MRILHEVLGFHFRLGVSVHVPNRQWFSFIRAVMMPGRIHAETADVHKALDFVARAGFEQVPRGLNVDGAIILDRTPFSDLGGTVHDDIDIGHSLPQDVNVGYIATMNLDSLLFKARSIAVRAGNRRNPMAALHASIGHMAADKAGGAGDQNSQWHAWYPRGSMGCHCLRGMAMERQGSGCGQDLNTARKKLTRHSPAGG